MLTNPLLSSTQSAYVAQIGSPDFGHRQGLAAPSDVSSISWHKGEAST
jgi:hypothetical protein